MKKNNKRKLTFLSTLLPVGVLAATSIPMVACGPKKVAEARFEMSTARAQKAKIKSIQYDDNKNAYIELECTSTVAEDRILSIDIKSGNKELLIGSDYQYDFDKNIIGIPQAVLELNPGKLVIDVGVGSQTFTKFTDAWKHFVDNRKALPGVPIGLNGALYQTVEGKTVKTEINAFYTSVWAFQYKNNLSAGVGEANSFVGMIDPTKADFSAEMEAALPNTAKYKIFAHTDKDDILVFVQYNETTKPSHVLAMNYNGYIRKFAGWDVGGSDPESDTEYVVDKYYWDEKDMTAVNINTDSCSIPLTTCSKIFAKSENAYKMKIQPTAAATGHFELTFITKLGDIVVVGASDEATYEASTEADVTLNIDLSKWSKLDVHQDVTLKWVATV